jgi:membrane protein YqaA with SNARE-associated domain
MTSFKRARSLFIHQGTNIHWVKLIITFGGLILLSFGLAALLQFIKSRLNLPLYDLATVAYATVFVSTILANMTIIAPVPFAVAIMISASSQFNPVLVAFFGALGGSLGELSGYFAGRLGKRIAIPDTFVGYKKVEGWIRKYGLLAITGLAFQPVVPFDIGGVVAGAAKMPISQFLPALFLGKFPKYIILVYAGLGVIHFLPSWMLGG